MEHEEQKDEVVEEPIPPSEFQDEESAAADDTVDDNENDVDPEPVNDPATHPPVEAPATTPQPSSGIEQAPGQPETQQSQGQQEVN